MRSAVIACDPETGSRKPAATIAQAESAAAPPLRSELVSVVIPCYNGAAFLAEAIASALEQTHTAVEVIVIDDGSTDDSAQIAQRFPIRYVYQENLGLSAARNAGIRISNGTYVVFLDADDRLLPAGIATGLRTLQLHAACAMAVGDHAFISTEGLRLRKSQKNGPVRRPYEALLKSNFIEMISSVLFRKSIFDQAGMFSTSLRVAEDYDLYLRIARIEPICFHQAIVAEYRLHSANTSHNSELMLTTTIAVLKDQKQFLTDDSKRAAFRYGVRSWRRQYGRRLVSELAASISLANVDRLPRKLWALAALYPQGLLLFALLRIRPTSLRRLGPLRHPLLPSSPRPSST